MCEKKVLLKLEAMKRYRYVYYRPKNGRKCEREGKNVNDTTTVLFYDRTIDIYYAEFPSYNALRAEVL